MSSGSLFQSEREVYFERFFLPQPSPCPVLCVGVTGRIPDEDEQSTGIERKELNKMLEGVEVSDNLPFSSVSIIQR